jgi:hypothetical protein
VDTKLDGLPPLPTTKAASQVEMTCFVESKKYGGKNGAGSERLNVERSVSWKYCGRTADVIPGQQ